MDLRLTWNGSAADLALSGSDLATDDGLETAVIISLGTERRAEDDDVPPDGTNNRRGWWADSFAPVEGDRIGSRVWLLAREKTQADALARAKSYAEEALAWLIEDGVAQRVEAAAERVSNEVLGLLVTIHRPEAPPVRYRFEAFWQRV